MIRPIDTQILHPQTPEIAGRQQRNNHLPVEQQSQFGDIMKKEVDHKKDMVIAPQNTENLKTNKDGSKERNDHNKKESKKRQQANNTSKDKVQKRTGNKIDIRI